MGYALRGGATFLVSLGLINQKDDEESKKVRQGEDYYGRNSTLNVTALKRYMRSGDPTPKTGDLNVGLKWFGVVGNLMNVHANTVNAENVAKSEGEGFDWIDKTASRLSHSTTEAMTNGVFSGSASLIRAINDGGNYLDSWGINMVNLGTNFFQPATYAQMSKAMLDEKTTYKADNFFLEIIENQKQRDMLFRAFAGKPQSKVTIWGDEAKKGEGIKSKMYNYLGAEETDRNKFGVLIYDDFRRTNDPYFFPSSIKSTITVGDKDVKLPASRLRELERLVGSARKYLVAPFVSGEAAMSTDDGDKYYFDMTDEEKVKALQELYREGYEEGMYTFKEAHPEYTTEEESDVVTTGFERKR